jgi:hypothetical protein
VSAETGTKILATLTAIVGGIASVYALLTAAGVEISTALQDGITGVLGLLLVIAGLWFHPSVPVGQTSADTPGG